MVGSIILTYRKRENVKTQSYLKQISREKSSAVILKEVDLKIIMIDNSEDLNVNSSNALLKAIEEPSKNTHFFIVNNNSKKISDTINKIIPHRIPDSTTFVWSPWKALSRDTSRHHWNITNIIIFKAIKNNKKLFIWNQLAKPKVKNKAPKPLIIGQGDSSTKW